RRAFPGWLPAHITVDLKVLSPQEPFEESYILRKCFSLSGTTRFYIQAFRSIGPRNRRSIWAFDILNWGRPLYSSPLFLNYTFPLGLHRRYCRYSPFGRTGILIIQYPYI